MTDRRLPLTRRMKPLLLGLALALASQGVAAQGLPQTEIVPSIPLTVDDGQPEWVENEFLVTFRTRSFDLEGLRQAILADRTAAEVDGIIEGYKKATAKDRTPFVKALEALGGEVIQNYWVVNASWVRLSEKQLAKLEALAGVLRVERNRIHELTVRTATNSLNLNSDAVNQLTVGGKKVIGTGMAVALLDTGVDSSMGFSGRPHAAYYPGGNPGNRTGGGIGGSRLLAALGIARSNDFEDLHGHGTWTSTSAAGAKFSSSFNSDDGPAPGAGVVGMKMSVGSRSGTTTGILAGGWQRVLTLRRTYNIVAANASYGGSNSLTSVDQQALDSAAHNGDVVICVSSGNSATNLRSSSATYNGLSVGATWKNTGGGFRLASFSGRGTIFGSGGRAKQIPDVVAPGVSIVVPHRDTENTFRSVSGTSFSSPLMAGCAVIIRHANPKITALETKALMINTAIAMGGGGAGFVKADQAAQAAIQTNVITKTMTRSNTKMSFPFVVKQAGTVSVAIAWNRKIFSTDRNDDLNLQVFNPSGQSVGSSNKDSMNSWERVSFPTFTAGTFRAEVTGNLSTNNSVDFAIAGVGQPTPPKPPTLTSISPAQVSAFGAKDVTLKGTNLDSVDKVLIGSQTIPPKSVAATQLTFAPPIPTALGKVQIKVSNPAGTSNGLDLTYVETSPPVQLIDKPFWLNSFFPQTNTVWGGANNVALFFLSFSNKSTTIPGVVNMGIGNAFQELFYLTGFVTNKVGQGAVTWKLPGGLAGKTLHMQFVVIAPNPKLPFPTTNVVSRLIQF